MVKKFSHGRRCSSWAASDQRHTLGVLLLIHQLLAYRSIRSPGISQTPPTTGWPDSQQTFLVNASGDRQIEDTANALNRETGVRNIEWQIACLLPITFGATKISLRSPVYMYNKGHVLPCHHTDVHRVIGASATRGRILWCVECRSIQVICLLIFFLFSLLEKRG